MSESIEYPFGLAVLSAPSSGRVALGLWFPATPPVRFVGSHTRWVCWSSPRRLTPQSDSAAKRKKLTIFFSDIANFTETTDSLESEELTNLLNQYLTEMSKIAVSHGTTIDKYVGDAIIGFFGDPASRGSKEDAITCVKMSIAMQRRMRELQLKWLDLGS